MRTFLRKCRNTRCNWVGREELCSPGGIDELSNIHFNHRCPSCYYFTETHTITTKKRLLERIKNFITQ